MSPDEADQLAKRIINTWRGGPPLDIWRDELTNLDAGTAGTAYARLRRSLDNAPSIARFMAEYKALNTDDASTRQPDCKWCDNTGWTETAPHQFRGWPYTGWQPCTHCREGRAREVSECWTKAPVRDFISDAEADRLTRALRPLAAAGAPRHMTTRQQGENP